MRFSSALCVFSLLSTVCASAGGHRLVRLERYSNDKLSSYETYQYEDSVLVSMTRVSYSLEHVDTTYYLYKTNQVGDIIEEVTYVTAVWKEGVKKSKFVSRSDGTSSSYALDGDEWFEWGWSRSDEQGRILEETDNGRYSYYIYDSLGRQTVKRSVISEREGVVVQRVDSMAYSADGLQTTRIMTYQEDDSPAVIYYLTNKNFDEKGRTIYEEQFYLDGTDDEHPSYNSYRYRYAKRRVIATYLDNKYKKGKYKERPYLKVKYVYNESGLRTKLVEYHIKHGLTWREALVKHEYDLETGDPLEETHYSYSFLPLSRKLSSKTVWTYE